MIGYILIQTDVGKSSDVTAAVAGVKGVVHAEAVTGPYDVIARAEAKNLRDLSVLVVDRIQDVEGVSRTLTCPVVHS
ncbi:MAG TPA: Lrp/AsnC ligand binding domain-containing protein [Actinomycetota bacterium]|nr:Lrp/AsnC ligand binding domain-containing protein [Actinomycetota bacterium]